MRPKTGFLVVAAAALFGACAAPNPPAANTANSTANVNTNSISNSNASTANTAAPSKEVLAGLEKQAFEAWKNKDGKFFDGFLAANFTMFEGGQTLDKAKTAEMIGANPCVVKGYSMSDEQVTPVSADVAVITMKVTADVTCEGKPMPSPVTSASIYVKQGNEWKAAFHAEVPVIDPKKNTQGGPTAPTGSSKPKSGVNAELTAKLLEREKMGWDGWKNHDQAKLNDFVADGAYAVGMFGERVPNKAEIVKAWSEPCDVKSVTLDNEHAVEITPAVALLFYKGSATGKCGDMDIKPQWAATLYTKQGETWRGAFFLASPG